MTHAPTRDAAEHRRAHAGAHSGIGGETIFLWVAILLALAFWAPLTFVVDSSILAAG